NANVERNGVLVLQLVSNATRLRSTRATSGEHGAAVPLVETHPQDFRRERQVLDGGPAGDRADHVDGEVGVADEVSRDGLAGHVDRTVLTLRSGQVRRNADARTRIRTA